MLTDLGYGRKSSRHRGSVILGILLFPDHEAFAWGGYVLHGTNRWWSWAGFDPSDLHWSTTSCTVWSVPWVHTIAHEMGHCFGLHHPHTDTDRKNRRHYGDYDNRLDLMVDVEQGGNLAIDWLKPYNAARVRDHFRASVSSSRVSKTAMEGN